MSKRDHEKDKLKEELVRDLWPPDIGALDLLSIIRSRGGWKETTGWLRGSEHDDGKVKVHLGDGGVLMVPRQEWDHANDCFHTELMALHVKETSTPPSSPTSPTLGTGTIIGFHWEKDRILLTVEVPVDVGRELAKDQPIGKIVHLVDETERGKT